MSQEQITVALAGNPNSGKTTMFNTLTGAHQHVGNYPGITVEKKEGYLKHEGVRLHFIDLPGTYSLTAYSQEELVARNFLVEQRPDVVIDIVNASALERNLYLAVQFLEMGIPLVLALNMMDEARKQGLDIDVKKLSELLGVPVVETVARHGMGKQALVRETVAFAAKRSGEWEPLILSYGPDLDPVIRNMTEKIEAEGFLTDLYPGRWTAIKYLEGDDEILSQGRKTGPLAETLESMVKNVSDHCRATLNTYPEAIIADYRYGFINSLLRQGVLSRSRRQERINTSDRMDRVLTHRYAGPVVMFAVLFLVYKLTFWFGETPLAWMQALFDLTGDLFTRILPDGKLQSLVVSGVIDGVGGVMSFVPLIMIMFFIIAFLEDSGYMARVAYMLDRVFRIFGLHGCSVMPYIVSGGIAGGCAVPGVLASRTLRSRKEKLATILTAPFMTCGAKLPVFILIVGVIFPRHQAEAMFLITLGAWATALIVAKFLRSTIIRGPSTPFVMELPPYRWPTARGMLIHTWERTWQYLKKAGTVILAISVLMWAAMTYPSMPEERARSYDARIAELQAEIQGADNDQVRWLDALTKDIEARKAEEGLRFSAAGRIGQAIEPVTRTAGFDWRVNIALLGGVAAKEVIISTLGTAYSLGDVGMDQSQPLARRLKQNPDFTRATGVSLIVFILLYAPCFVTLVTIAQESGTWRWAAFALLFNTTVAFGLSAAIYRIGLLLQG